MSKLTGLNQLGARYLAHLYDSTQGRPAPADVDRRAMADGLGLDYDNANDICRYLVGEGLVLDGPTIGKVSITHEGIRWVEANAT